LTQNKAKLCKIFITTLVFEKKRQFFRQKLSKIAENSDHNIDPWYIDEATFFQKSMPRFSPKNVAAFVEVAQGDGRQRVGGLRAHEVQDVAPLAPRRLDVLQGRGFKSNACVNRP
jgi:hypothetical protein